jgi:hypothetical protein
MKINGKTLAMVMVMAIGAIGATGCNGMTDDGAIAPVESVASAPVEDGADSAGAETNGLRFFFGTRTRRYYAPMAPPATRFEARTRAPSSRHFWAPGYYRWNGRQHVWVAGRWELRRNGYEFVSPRWVRSQSRWQYVPGHWVRR